MLVTLALVAGAFILFAMLALVLKAMALLLNFVLLPVKIVLGGILALGGLMAGVLLLPFVLGVALLSLAGALVGAILLLAIVF